MLSHTGASPGQPKLVASLEDPALYLSRELSWLAFNDRVLEEALDPQTPLRALHREVKANPADFDQFVGKYAIGEGFFVSIIRDRDRLYIEPAGQPRAELFAESDNKFFLRNLNAEVTFQLDESGYAQSLLLAQDGEVRAAKRIQ